MNALSRRIPRRMFLGFGATTAAVAAVACSQHNREPRTTASAGSTDRPARPAASPPGADAAVPRRPLGRTGETVSIVGLGGYHLGLAKNEQEATRIVRSAIDRGMTFLDNCWDYHGGKSEELMGRALRDGYRDKAFLMTKIDGRTRKVATEQLDQSLKRLGTDRIDLLQIHEVIRMTDPARSFADDGCIRALEDAKKAGKIRFTGFTGHKDPDIHLAMLKAADEHGYSFDAVQMPLNVMDAHYRSFEDKVLPVLVQKNIGVLGMKTLGAGKILKSKTASAVECLHYAMNLPTSVVITGCEDMERLDQAIGAATSFEPMPEEKVARLLARTKEAAKEGKYEVFKTTTEHDGTVQNPKWLESAVI